MDEAGADDFQRVFSGAPWEEKVGYCRALRAGSHVYVTGTVAIGADGALVGVGDGHAQARRCLEIIEASLERLGCDRRAIVRTRMFTTDISRWAEYGRAHREFFGDHRPTTTLVEVRALIGPDMLIEIEADAYSTP